MLANVVPSTGVRFLRGQGRDVCNDLFRPLPSTHVSDADEELERTREIVDEIVDTLMDAQYQCCGEHCIVDNTELSRSDYLVSRFLVLLGGYRRNFFFAGTHCWLSEHL